MSAKAQPALGLSKTSRTSARKSKAEEKKSTWHETLSFTYHVLSTESGCLIGPTPEDEGSDGSSSILAVLPITSNVRDAHAFTLAEALRLAENPHMQDLDVPPFSMKVHRVTATYTVTDCSESVANAEKRAALARLTDRQRKILGLADLDPDDFG